MKKRIIAVLVALVVAAMLAVPTVGAISYNDPGISTSESIDLQFPWSTDVLVYGDSSVYDLNIALAAADLSAAVELGTSYADYALEELDLAGTIAHYGYGANSDVSHSFSLKPVTVDGVDYNLITIIGRGTMSVSDMWLDATPGALSSNANVILNNLYAFLADNGLTVDDPANRFFVTGHSLGGAVSNLVSHRLAKNGVDRSAIYGYCIASPWTARYTDADVNDDNNIFNLIGGATKNDPTYDFFCWTSDETYTNWFSRNSEYKYRCRYGTDITFTQQSNAFKSVYKTLTGNT